MPDMHPLTEAQEGLWYFQALDPANPILNTGQYLDLRGPVDLDALHKALTRTLAETEALRLRFRQGPHGPEQWLDLAPILPAVVHVDEAEALAMMRADQCGTLDLAADPAAAFTIFILGPGRVLVYQRIHHLATDGYGMVLLTNRIGEHYSAIVTGGPSPLPFPSLDRAHDEDAAYRASDRRAGDAAWWRDRMEGLPEVTGPAGGSAVSAHHYLRESRRLDPALLGRLAEFSDAHDLGWPDVLTGLAGAYLARWTGGEGVIGVPFMARMGRKIARLPCMAMNVLPQRVTLDEDAPLADWLGALTRDMTQARRHGLYRSEQLRRDLGLVGGARRLHGPLVNVQPFDCAPRFHGLKVGLHILGAGAVDDLTLTFRGDPRSGLLFEVDANPHLYSPQDVAGHSARLPDFIAAALDAATLAQVPTASPAEIAAAAVVNATGHPVPNATLVALIDAQMAATPDAPAVTFGGTTISFADLDRRSAALAAHLAQRGAGPGRIVAVALERSLDLPMVLLAILRSGAAYLPLDPDHPSERIERILSKAHPVAIVTQPDLAPLFPADVPLLTDWPAHGPAPTPPTPTPPTPDDMAYVIFTSGSTGEPKGVVIDHRAIVNRLLWMRDHYGIDASDRILQKTPATFDVSVWEFFLPMIAGAELVMAPPGAHRDPSAIAALIRRHAITTLHFVPSMLSAFLAAPASDGIALRRVFCSGEELTVDQRTRFHARIRAELHNLYGPTEAAVDVSFWPAGPDDASNPLPIGWPVWNTSLHVLDDRMRPVPPGLAGHLYLGGAQLARGYLGRDDLTAQRFIIGPGGTRLYATGDLAHRRPDGAVVYLGRSDHQVKIRGLRIELGEIETAIMASSLAREGVVAAWDDGTGDRRLVAYVVPSAAWAEGLLARHLSSVLPAYMVPFAEVTLDALPVTANGKLDRKALPAPRVSAAGRGAESDSERLLSRLYAEILHLPAPPGIGADFFALGGDSLSAVRLVLRIEEETGHDPGLGTVFEHSVLEHLAAALLTRQQDDGLRPLILLAEGDPAAAPLFLIHPAGGIAWGYRHLARLIAPARRVWGVQHPCLDMTVPLPPDLDSLARDYAAQIARVAPHGPVHLAGWSVGGILAQAVAIELSALGHQAGVVVALDSYPADAWRAEPEPDPVAALRALLAIAGHDPDAHRDLDSRAKVVAFLRAGDTPLGALPEAVLDGVVRTVTDTNRMIRAHRHRRWPGTLTHVRAALDHKDRDLRARMWQPYAGRVEELSVPFLHPAMTSAEASALIAPMMAQRMDQAAAKDSASGRDPAIVSM